MQERIRRGLQVQSDLLVPLFPAFQAGSVIVPESQEVVIRHQALDGVTHYVDVDGFFHHAKSEKRREVKRSFFDVFLYYLTKMFLILTVNMHETYYSVLLNSIHLIKF